MDLAARTLQELSPFAAGFLFASVWQGVLLTAGLALCLRVFRGVAPAVRMALWTAVLPLVVVLPGAALLVPRAAAGGHRELHVGQDWSVAIVAVWLLFSAVRGLRLAGSAVRLLRLAARAVPVPASEEIQALLQGSRRATLCVSGEVDRPSVTGFLRPRILLPPGLLETLSPVELEHVVLHEMEHLRRWDDWLNLLQQVSLLLLPLNPALLWLDHRLCRERELACDDGVLQATQARRAYAACLVKLAEDSLVRKGVALALSALGSKSRESELVGRVRRILAGPETMPRPSRRRFAVGAAVSSVLLLAGVLARSPQMVRFDAAPDTVAQASLRNLPLRPQPGQGNLLPVRAVMGGDAPRPVLTGAVARPEVRAHMPRRVAAVTVLRRKRVVPIVPLEADLPGEPQVESWRAVSSEAVAGAAPARIVVTEYEVSPPVYAAVPWRGGWLILQL